MKPTEIADELEKLLDDESVDENALQTFLESNTEAILTPQLLNHRLHFDSIISKFGVAGLSTDFAYLTKSSNLWKLVLVEIETPGKKIFKKNSKHHAMTAEFNDAMAQLHVWRDYADRDMVDIRRRLSPLMGSAPTALELSFVLIIGRDKELEGQPDRRDRLASFLKADSFQILTWDSVLRELRERSVRKKCILAETSRGFRIKHMHRIPSLIFARVPPGRLEVPTQAREILVKAGYDMDAWDGGELLTHNEKQPGSQRSIDFTAALVAARATQKRNGS